MVLMSDIIAEVEKLAPPEIAQEWDNVGLSVGRRDKRVSKVLLALDADVNVIKEAANIGADAILTHHPLIFDPIKKINSDSELGRSVTFLVEHDISLYSAHTNLDAADGGLNDFLADLYELQNVYPMLDMREFGGKMYGIARCGELKEEMTLEKLAGVVSEKIGSKNILYVGDKQAKIRRAAICSGGGGSMVGDELVGVADVYITGDVKYSNARNAIAAGLNIICVEHYDSEIFCMDIFGRILKNLDVETVKSKANINVFKRLF